MPTHFGMLTRLRTLDVGQNNNREDAAFAKEHVPEQPPTELGRLTSLRALRFDENQLQGSIATEWSP